MAAFVVDSDEGGAPDFDGFADKAE